MNEMKETKEQLITQRQENLAIESLQKEKDWFMIIGEAVDEKNDYDKEEIKTELRTDILNGKYQKTDDVVIYYKDKEGSWQQSNTSLEEFAKNYFELRVLYQPVWSHAMAGLKWGAIIGIVLKLLDTLILLGAVDPILALLFLGAIAVVFIPRVGMIGVFAVIFLSMKYTRANFFIIGIMAALTGASLGCLPGMAIGGFIGYIRKNSIPVAIDGLPESRGLYFKATIVPFFVGVSLFVFYIYVVNPWLMKVIE